MSFGVELRDAGVALGRLCVGIDPHAELLSAWGLPQDARGLRMFSEICVEAFSGRVALVKPQVSFFEEYGAQGYAVLEDTIGALRAAGTLVVADAKRGDIGSTMAGYARAWLRPGAALECDALTLSPYLGFGSLAPAIDFALEHGKGVFVLAATSNPEARWVQECSRDGLSVQQHMVDQAAACNEGAAAGSVGVVVGATLTAPPVLSHLNGPVLLPGVGAQGASMADVERITAGVQELSFANVSRSVLSKGPDIEALREALS